MKKKYSPFTKFFGPWITLLGAVASALALTTSCSPGKESDLKVAMPGGETFALPSVSTSCSSLLPGNLKENSFGFNTLTLTWANTVDNVYIIAIKMEFKSPNLADGIYSCTLTGDEIGMVFATGITPWNGILSQAVGTTEAVLSKTNSCKLKCGGVKYAAGLPATTAMGTVTVLGIQRSPTGEEKPVKGSTQLKLNFGGGL